MCEHTISNISNESSKSCSLESSVGDAVSLGIECEFFYVGRPFHCLWVVRLDVLDDCKDFRRFCHAKSYMSFDVANYVVYARTYI